MTRSRIRRKCNYSSNIAKEDDGYTLQNNTMFINMDLSMVLKRGVDSKSKAIEVTLILHKKCLRILLVVDKVLKDLISRRRSA